MSARNVVDYSGDKLSRARGQQDGSAHKVATKPDNLNLIPRTHRAEVEN